MNDIAVNEKVAKARNLFGDFSGHCLDQQFDVDLDSMVDDDNAVLFAFGRLDGFILIGDLEDPDDNETVKFAPDIAPLICSRHDGKALYIVGGDFEFELLGPAYVVDILYSTFRDFKYEEYIHRFDPDDMPMLISNAEGDELFLEGGRYTFTDEGIVNK